MRTGTIFVLTFCLMRNEPLLLCTVNMERLTDGTASLDEGSIKVVGGTRNHRNFAVGPIEI